MKAKRRGLIQKYSFSLKEFDLTPEGIVFTFSARYSLGYHTITNIDFVPGVIKSMQDLPENQLPGLSFQCMDVREMTFPDNTFQSVLDKGEAFE